MPENGYYNSNNLPVWYRCQMMKDRWEPYRWNTCEKWGDWLVQTLLARPEQNFQRVPSRPSYRSKKNVNEIIEHFYRFQVDTFARCVWSGDDLDFWAVQTKTRIARSKKFELRKISIVRQTWSDLKHSGLCKRAQQSDVVHWQRRLWGHLKNTDGTNHFHAQPKPTKSGNQEWTQLQVHQNDFSALYD
jgi:hypothetical protein